MDVAPEPSTWLADSKAPVVSRAMLAEPEPAIDASALLPLPVLTASPRPTATSWPPARACSCRPPAPSSRTMRLLSCTSAWVLLSSRFRPSVPATATEYCDPPPPLRLSAALPAAAKMLVLRSACTLAPSLPDNSMRAPSSSAVVSICARLTAALPAPARLIFGCELDDEPDDPADCESSCWLPW